MLLAQHSGGLAQSEQHDVILKGESVEEGVFDDT